VVAHEAKCGVHSRCRSSVSLHQPRTQLAEYVWTADVPAVIHEAIPDRLSTIGTGRPQSPARQHSLTIWNALVGADLTDDGVGPWWESRMLICLSCLLAVLVASDDGMPAPRTRQAPRPQTCATGRRVRPAVC
jgi:hypothetical protein